jgi:kumamolisin
MEAKTTSHRTFLLAVALAVAIANSSQGQTNTIVADVLRIPDVRDLGRRQARELVNVLVTLRFNHDDQLEQLLQQQSDPNSPNYQKFLTPTEFAERFGPTAEQLGTIVTELKRAGFEITSIAPNRLIVHATAPSVTVENFFKTEIHSVAQGAHGKRYMNVIPATLPDSVAALVKGVRIDNLIVAHKLSHRVNIVSNTINGPITGPDGGYTPVAIADSFYFPTQHGYDGTGHIAAVIIDSDVAQTDLNSFFAYFPIQRTGSIIRRSIDGAVVRSTNSDDDETALGVETIASLAPGASVVIDLIPELSDQAIDDAVNQIVSDNDCEAVNMSFGGNEYQDSTFEAAVRQGNVQGITFVAPSGDSGSNGGVVSTPAAEPRVLAVGGTNFTARSNGRAMEAKLAGAGRGEGFAIIRDPCVSAGNFWIGLNHSS